MSVNTLSIQQAQDFLNCRNLEALTSEKMFPHLDAMIEESGFSFKKSIHSVFPGGGFTYVAIIGESSVDIHTWPEHKAVQITIYYCNFSKNNNARAYQFFRLMKRYFQPREVVLYAKTKRRI